MWKSCSKKLPVHWKYSIFFLCIFLDHWVWLCVSEPVRLWCCFPLEPKPFPRFTVGYCDKSLFRFTRIFFCGNSCSPKSPSAEVFGLFACLPPPHQPTHHHHHPYSPTPKFTNPIRITTLCCSLCFLCIWCFADKNTLSRLDLETVPGIIITGLYLKIW